MIRVTVDLLSARDGRTERMGTMLICNDGTGTDTLGNYIVQVMRKGSRTVARQGTVRGYKRKADSVWVLVMAALKNVFWEER